MSDVRLATPADLEALYHIQTRPSSRDAGFLWRAALAQRIDAGHVYVALENAEPAGYVLAAPRRDRRCHVSQVVVSEDLWRSGHGARLMRRAALLGLARGCNALTVKCARDALASSWWPLVGMRAVDVVQGQRRPLIAWCRPLGPVGELRMPPRPRRRSTAWGGRPR